MLFSLPPLWVQSMYGSEITIAVAGIMQKINAIFVAAVIGVEQNEQNI